MGERKTNREKFLEHMAVHGAMLRFKLAGYGVDDISKLCRINDEYVAFAQAMMKSNAKEMDQHQSKIGDLVKSCGIEGRSLDTIMRIAPRMVQQCERYRKPTPLEYTNDEINEAITEQFTRISEVTT